MSKISKELSFIAGKISKEELLKEDVMDYMKKKIGLKSNILNAINNLTGDVERIHSIASGNNNHIYGRQEEDCLTPEEKSKLKKLAYKMLRRHLTEVEHLIEDLFIGSTGDNEETEVEISVGNFAGDNQIPGQEW